MDGEASPDGDAWWLVCGLYGRLMFEVQWFELDVRGLSGLIEPDAQDRSLDEAVTHLFKRPLRGLANRIPGDASLRDDLTAAVNTRNTLAHEFLVSSELRVKAGSASVDEIVELLNEVHGKYEDLRRRLAAFRAQMESELGIVDATGGLTDDDVARLIREADENI